MAPQSTRRYHMELRAIATARQAAHMRAWKPGTQKHIMGREASGQDEEDAQRGCT